MSIDKIVGGFENIQPVRSLQAPSGSQAVEQGGGKAFGKMLADAIQEVDKMQTEADGQIAGLALGKEGVTPHGAMIALEKADIAFQLMNQIRGKIIRAYEEIVRTQI